MALIKDNILYPILDWYDKILRNILSLVFKKDC